MSKHISKNKQPKWIWVVFGISITFFLISMCSAPKISSVNSTVPATQPVTVTVPVPYTVTVPATATTTTTTSKQVPTSYYLPEGENQNLPDVDIPRTWYPCVPGSKKDRDKDGKCGE